MKPNVLPIENEAQVDIALQQILIDQFNVEVDKIYWDIPLGDIEPRLNQLDHLLYFEQLLDKKFDRNVQILERIHSSIHSLKDIKTLIINQINK